MKKNTKATAVDSGNTEAGPRGKREKRPGTQKKSKTRTEARSRNLSAVAGEQPMDGAAAAEAIMANLDLDPKGTPMKTLANVFVVLTEDPQWAGQIGRDVWSRITTVLGRPLSEAILTRVRMEVGRRYGFEPSKSAVAETIELIASERPIDLLSEYLTSLEWDGQERLPTLAADAFGAATGFCRLLVARWCLGAVRRALKPGCAMNGILLLQGADGLGKSEALRTLAGPDWYRYVDVDTRARPRGGYQLAQTWICEPGDLSSHKGAAWTRLGRFLLATEDFVNGPGRGAAERVPRRTVFAATTSEPTPFPHPRWSEVIWPIKVGHATDIEYLAENRDQIWAEAMARLDGGEPWTLDEGQRLTCARLNGRLLVPDPWERPILNWLVDRKGTEFTSEACLDGALEIPPEKKDRSHENHLGRVLASLGCTKRRAGRKETEDGSRPWLWEAPSRLALE